uniref:DNA2/NAM7 helicase helicase domain-containing protein n=1 Tax=Ditylenchus dipsaci TaxID=166011 RepID=A0A915CV06_9BILA
MGRLPEEDIRVLLKRNGDFLVRTAEPKAGQTRCFILSVMYDETREEAGVIRIVKLSKAVINRNAIPRVGTEGALPGVKSSYRTLGSLEAVEHRYSACSPALYLDYSALILELCYNIAKASSFYEFVRLQGASKGNSAHSMSTMIRLAELLFKDYKLHVVDSLQLGTKKSVSNTGICGRTLQVLEVSGQRSQQQIDFTRERVRLFDMDATRAIHELCKEAKQVKVVLVDKHPSPSGDLSQEAGSQSGQRKQGEKLSSVQEPMALVLSKGSKQPDLIQVRSRLASASINNQREAKLRSGAYGLDLTEAKKGLEITVDVSVEVSEVTEIQDSRLHAKNEETSVPQPVFIVNQNRQPAPIAQKPRLRDIMLRSARTAKIRSSRVTLPRIAHSRARIVSEFSKWRLQDANVYVVQEKCDIFSSKRCAFELTYPSMDESGKKKMVSTDMFGLVHRLSSKLIQVHVNSTDLLGLVKRSPAGFTEYYFPVHSEMFVRPMSSHGLYKQYAKNMGEKSAKSCIWRLPLDLRCLVPDFDENLYAMNSNEMEPQIISKLPPSQINREELLETARNLTQFVCFNDSQKTAVEIALQENSIGIVQGPPGTGKTRVAACVALAYYLLGGTVLCVAVTNSAVNHLLEVVVEMVQIFHGEDITASMAQFVNKTVRIFADYLESSYSLEHSDLEIKDEQVAEILQMTPLNCRSFHSIIVKLSHP